MKVHGESGVLMSMLSCMWWVYERILWGIGWSFVIIPDLRWEMTLRLNSDMIFGVGIWPLRAFLALFGIGWANDASFTAHMKFSRGAIQ
jgi:hypothetical protein